MWMITRLRCLDRRLRIAVGVALTLLLSVSAAWIPALDQLHYRAVNAALRMGWAIETPARPAQPWFGTSLPLGTAHLRTAHLVWHAENTRYVVSASGAYWLADGPHLVRWGTLGPVSLSGPIRIDEGPPFTVFSAGLALTSAGPAVPLQGTPMRWSPMRWSPASFENGTLVLSGVPSAMGNAPAGAPGFSMAAGAVLRLLTGADGTATLPIRRDGAAVTIAGFPVLPWPRDDPR